jgi:hypothetical protein
LLSYLSVYEAITAKNVQYSYVLTSVTVWMHMFLFAIHYLIEQPQHTVLLPSEIPHYVSLYDFYV